MQADYVELCYSKKRRDEHRLTMKLSFCCEAHAWIEYFLCKLVLGARREKKRAKWMIETRYRTCYATFICKISGGKSEINFNDIKSPETPSVEMNYATHQKKVQQHPSWRCQFFSILPLHEAIFFLQHVFLVPFISVPAARGASNNRCHKRQHFLII